MSFPRDPRSYLWDVMDAADSILSFTNGLAEEEYLGHPIVRAAVERKFQIIGEALNLLRKTAPGLAGRIPDLADIVAFRNVIVHGYESLDHARVWDRIVGPLPKLRDAVADLLEEIADKS